MSPTYTVNFRSLMLTPRALVSPLFVILAACSHPMPKIEVVSFQEQVREEVEEHPTQFQLPKQSDAQAWTRAQLFFRDYELTTPIVSRNEIKSNPKEDKRFLYQISRVGHGKEVEYVVNCVGREPRDSEVAEVNAKNVARFLKEGQLELSLLAK